MYYTYWARVMSRSIEKDYLKPKELGEHMKSVSLPKYQMKMSKYFPRQNIAQIHHHLRCPST